jgi:hypothetical protein
MASQRPIGFIAIGAEHLSTPWFIARSMNMRANYRRHRHEAAKILVMGPGADPADFPRSRDLLSL